MWWAFCCIKSVNAEFLNQIRYFLIEKEMLSSHCSFSKIMLCIRIHRNFVYICWWNKVCFLRDLRSVTCWWRLIRSVNLALLMRSVIHNCFYTFPVGRHSWGQWSLSLPILSYTLNFLFVKTVFFLKFCFQNNHLIGPSTVLSSSSSLAPKPNAGLGLHNGSPPNLRSEATFLVS